jgi:murein L,D-transpeptidase YafK
MRVAWIALFVPALLAAQSCPDDGDTVLVTASEHRLTLCEKGHPAGEYRVALGKGGTGKTREGDHLTPLGRYPLGEPRPSNKFHLFIPVGYPTVVQHRKAYTGSAVGIHGPWQPLRFLGGLLVHWDWTEGCIATGSNGDIETVARWVRAHPGVPLDIR